MLSKKESITEKCMHNALYISSLQDLTYFWQRDSTNGGARSRHQGQPVTQVSQALQLSHWMQLAGSNVPTSLNTEPSGLDMCL